MTVNQESKVESMIQDFQSSVLGNKSNFTYILIFGNPVFDRLTVASLFSELARDNDDDISLPQQSPFLS